ncbi:hypothetical protein CU097_000255, partial [Rhizopus azygosporus]
MAILSQGVGYGVVLGFGALFALIMTGITYLCKRYLKEVQTSEMYMTAQRTVKTGLVASAIVSSWTWAATLLTSTEVAYKYGVSGPIWYASGAVVQVLLFAVLAIELKRRAPNAHTFLEVVLARYGKGAHAVYLAFSLLTNIIVTAMLLLGGSAVVNYLTGMHTIAACFLLPLGVIVYTLFGGIKATFMSDYAHTVVIFIIIISFVFTVYASSPKIGSISTMYDLLTAASAASPIADNQGGSLVTMSSLQALLFGIINIVGNFGTVFVDNAYWQRAIAAHPQYAVKAYLIGGLSWFAIPFTLATTMGLAGRALQIDLTPFAVSQGLVLPDVAVALLGQAGGFACLVLVFMAVTSASSAELIAVSSVMTYDVYRTYIRPDAEGKQVVHFSHICVIAFGILMGVLAVLLNLTGINLGYLYTLMGVLISSAVVPLTLTLLWSKQNKTAAIVSPLFGFCAAVSTWLAVTYSMYGTITVETTAQNYPMMSGNIVALVSPIFVILPLSLIWPDNFDFDATRKIEKIDDSNDIGHEASKITQDELISMAKSSRFAKISSAVLSLALFILWPLPMFFSRYIFSKSFFTGWVVVSIIWMFCSFFAVGIYPVYEARHTLVNVTRELWRDLTGQHVPNLPQATHLSEENIVVYTNEKKQKTLAIIKPDAYHAKDKIIERIRQEGFTIVQEREITLTEETARLFYKEHEAKPFYEDVVKWISSSPIYAMVLEKEDAVQSWRLLIGPTDSNKAKATEQNSIRALFGTDALHNAVHGSDCHTNAEREIDLLFGQSDRDSDSSKESLAIQDNTDLSVHTADHVEHTHQSEEKSDDAILTTDKRDATQEASMNQTEQEAAKEIEQPKDASEQANDQPEQKSSHDEKQQGTEEQANVTTGTAANEKTDLVTPVLTQSEEQQATEHDPFETVEITNDVQEHEVYEQIVTEVSVIEEQESSTILSKEQINKPNQISEMTTVSLLEVAQKHEVSAVTEQVVHTEVITKDIKQETINDIKTTENVDDEATTAENIKDSAESKVAETINGHNENKVDDTVKHEDKVTEKSNDESKVPEIAKNDDSCKASVATKADDESKVADKNEDGASSAEVEHKELVEQGDVKTEEAKQEQVDTIVKEEPVEAQENKVEENVKREASVNKEPVSIHEDQHQTNARTEQT